jgi:hypothetical protein
VPNGLYDILTVSLAAIKPVLIVKAKQAHVHHLSSKFERVV